MKQYLFLLAWLFPFLLLSQERGVAPVPLSSGISPNTTTWAVVVGISDYQSPSIPDLQFADRDAAAFASWLESPSGGKVPAENIKLLLNEQATGAAFAGAVDWLSEVASENDQALIYFSGHGDVAHKSLSQPGFLLCWDASANVYMAGGTYSLYFLQEMISTMSVLNKARVLLIADACRSGKLAGSSIRGAQLTASNLARQYENELKILSCQPNEYSHEGEQWGGGRGVFSFHLLEGLTGLADSNGDKEVSLLEIGRYLQDLVSRDMDPLSQLPMTVGSPTTTVAVVDDVSLHKLLENKENENVGLEAVAGKAPLLFGEADSVVLSYYRAFDLALAENHFFEPENTCAEYYYNLLIASPSIANSYSSITRKYAVALQDAAQQSVNAILNSDPEEITKSRVGNYTKYKDFPRQLGRAAELLGERHYMYNNLKARQYLFEGVVLYFKYMAAKENTAGQGKEIMQYYNRSLDFEPEFPATYYFKGICFSKILKEPDSAKYCALSAAKYAGTWTQPFTTIGFSLIRDCKKFEEGKELLEEAKKIDSLDVGYWKALTAYYAYQGEIDSAVEVAEKTVNVAPDDPLVWYNIGVLKQAQYKFDESETAFLKSLELDSSQYRSLYYLAKNYYRWKKYDPAEKYYLKAISVDPENELARSALAAFYVGFEKYKNAEDQYMELIRYVDPGASTWLSIAWVTTLNGDAERGLIYLENALKKGYKKQEIILEDEGFLPLRALPGFNQLMDNYFKK